MSKVVAKNVPLNGLDLSGKHALVTGGGTGLGRQMADALAEGGARAWTICGRRAAPLEGCGGGGRRRRTRYQLDGGRRHEPVRPPQAL